MEQQEPGADAMAFVSRRRRHEVGPLGYVVTGTLVLAGVIATYFPGIVTSALLALNALVVRLVALGST